MMVVASLCFKVGMEKTFSNILGISSDLKTNKGHWVDAKMPRVEDEASLHLVHSHPNTQHKYVFTVVPLGRVCNK